MSVYFRIDPEAHQLQLDPGAKVIRAKDHAVMVAAEHLLSSVRAHEKKVYARTQDVFLALQKKGYEEGLKGAEQERAEAIYAVNGKLAEYLAEVETSLLNVVSSVVQRILGDMSAEVLIAKQVKQALDAYSKPARIRLKVNADLAPKVDAQLQTYVSGHPFIQYIEVQADYEMSERRCVMETDSEVIIMDADEQLEAIMNMMSELKQNASEH